MPRLAISDGASASGRGARTYGVAIVRRHDDARSDVLADADADDDDDDAGDGGRAPATAARPKWYRR